MNLKTSFEQFVVAKSIHERTLYRSHYKLSVLNLNIFLLIFLGMTYHGDLYYEGKEFEIRLKEKKPGDLTDDLRTALGMPVGPNAHKVNFIIIYFFNCAKNLFA